ncbi:MAG: DinB family protein [Phycisphaerae bacterium]
MSHFYATLPKELQDLSLHEAIRLYENGPAKIQDAITGLSHEQLNSFPIPGTWSIQQIVVHLLDSDILASVRMKRVIAENDPTLELYDESAFARKLGYDRMDLDLVMDLFVQNRRLNASILRLLQPAEFDRTGLHPEFGPITLRQLLNAYIFHVDHHLSFIKKKRELVVATPSAS